MELNRNPENFFAEIEQAAFSPANIVPGIGFSPDKMLQARLFSYGDTQRYRLGINFNHIPVNAPQCPFTQLSPRRRDADRRQSGRHAQLLAQQQGCLDRPSGGLDGAAAASSRVMPRIGIIASTRTISSSPAICSGR